MMNTVMFWAAAIICLATVILHIFVGGRLFLKPVLALEMEPTQRSMIYYCWHIATIILTVVALGFTAAAMMEDHVDYAIVSTTIAFLLVILATVVAQREKLPLTTFPVIPLFSLVIVIGLTGILA